MVPTDRRYSKEHEWILVDGECLWWNAGIDGRWSTTQASGGRNRHGID